jgi:hypothetical protein
MPGGSGAIGISSLTISSTSSLIEISDEGGGGELGSCGVVDKRGLDLFSNNHPTYL